LFGWKVRLLTRKLHAHAAKGDREADSDLREETEGNHRDGGPVLHPERAGDNGRCQASTRYGRAHRGVKPAAVSRSSGGPDPAGSRPTSPDIR
jgi:hypothetical protein